ncbi:hypothetical protein HPB47_017788 [Ixodes persulcatus]|uniref:Uncharacterized protein n=1 Tax=Ixodes persulcatus TaxID=34615 RepID=A0AC60QNE3_IXOPE|nr:hypothetical protein HPB47_017788 [Ixodes persulcatus]
MRGPQDNLYGVALAAADVHTCPAKRLGAQPDAIAERLRLKWTKRKDALVVCSIPEIKSRGKGIQATTMLLNAKLKKMCKDIKARRTQQYQDYLMTDLRPQGNHHHQELLATPVMGGYTTYPYSDILPTPVNQMQPPSQTPTPQYPDMLHPWLYRPQGQYGMGSQRMMGQWFRHSD